MNTQAEHPKGFVRDLAALLNGKNGNGFVSQKRSFHIGKNNALLAPSKISSGKGNLKAPIVSSPKAKKTGVTAVPKQRSAVDLFPTKNLNLSFEYDYKTPTYNDTRFGGTGDKRNSFSFSGDYAFKKFLRFSMYFE